MTETPPAYLDLQDANSVIRESRIKAQLPRYKRQYWGVTRHGRREILIHYHQDTPVGQNRLWLQSMLAVMGATRDNLMRSSVRTEFAHKRQLARFTGATIAGVVVLHEFRQV